MGFITGVITGIAAAAVAAAWYLARSRERFREQYRLERRLAGLGDELDARTRDMQAALGSRLAELRGVADLGRPATTDDGARDTLDPVLASAAEAEAAAAATADEPTKPVRKPKATPAQ